MIILVNHNLESFEMKILALLVLVHTATWTSGQETMTIQVQEQIKSDERYIDAFTERSQCLKMASKIFSHNLGNEINYNLTIEEAFPKLNKTCEELKADDSVNTLFREREKVPPNEVKQILIAAVARTGSSFLGDFLQHYPGNFYTFEPLEFLNVKANPFNKVSYWDEPISNIFKCNYDSGIMSEFLKFYRDRKFKQFSTRHRNVCKNLLPHQSACYYEEFYMETCPLLPIRTIKTIRIRYNQAEKFLSDPEMPNFKLIALFRDPRGTWNSRRVMKWSREIANVSMICQIMNDDLQASIRLKEMYPERVAILRYEDLALRPRETIEKVLNFLDLPMSRSMEKFIESHTQNANSTMNKYSTIRDSKMTVTAWQRQMKNIPEIEEIQEKCSKSLKILGYELVDVPMNKQF